MCCAVISKIPFLKTFTPRPKSRQSQRIFDVNRSWMFHTFDLNHLNNWHYSTQRFPKVSQGFQKGFHMSFLRKFATTRSLFQSLWHKCITRGWICTFTSNPTRFWIFCEWLSSTISFVDVIKICWSYALKYACLIDSRHISRNLVEIWRNLWEILEKSGKVFCNLSLVVLGSLTARCLNNKLL